MRILIVGSDSPVGQALQEFLRGRGRVVETLSRQECRWKSERALKKVLRRANCAVVVDARIEAAADGGEKISELDIERTRWLARVCQRSDMLYFYLSSSRVFSGDLDRLYNEEDYPDAAEALGQALLHGEENARHGCEKTVVLRLGPVFSHQGVNVLTHMLRQLRAGGSLRLVSYSRGSPVPASDAARVISGMLDQLGAGAPVRGIYHYCSSDSTHCYEFAEVLLASASQFASFGVAAVELVQAEDGGLQRNRSLDCNKLRNTFAIKQLPWRGQVADTVKRYFDAHSDTQDIS